MKQEEQAREEDREPGAHVGELLDAYRSRELDTSARARVEAHLAECLRCREELESLGSWAGAIERGYAAHRAGAAGLEPDWAAQRAAIVGRTWGRDRATGGKRAFWRWAPQVALVALAVLIVGIVWRENPRAPSGSNPPEQSERAAAPPAADGRFGEEKPAALRKEAVREVDADVEGEDALGRVGVRERLDEPLPAALADRAAEVSLAAPLAPEAERFERQARAALAARDTTAARRALALWSDTLAPAGEVAGGRAALADSLRKLLETAE